MRKNINIVAIVTTIGFILLFTMYLLSEFFQTQFLIYLKITAGFIYYLIYIVLLGINYPSKYSKYLLVICFSMIILFIIFIQEISKFQVWQIGGIFSLLIFSVALFRILNTRENRK